MVGNGELSEAGQEAAAYFIEHNDGLRTTLLMLTARSRFNSRQVKSMPGIQSTQFFLSPIPNVTYSPAW